MIRRLLPACLGVLLTAVPASAQLPTFDALAFIQHKIMNAVQDHLLDVERQKDDWLRRAGRGFWIFQNVEKYRVPNQPLWRTRHLDIMLPDALAYMEALNAGDATGAEVDRSLVLPSIWPLVGRDALAQQATREMGEDAAKAAVNQAGKIRGNRRSLSVNAIAALEHDTVDVTGSGTRSADVMVAGSLLGLRQQQERASLLLSVNELLQVTTKRRRDVEERGLRLQMRTRPANIVDGASDALENWRTP